MAIRNALIPFQLPEAADVGNFTTPLMAGVRRGDQLRQQGIENQMADQRMQMARQQLQLSQNADSRAGEAHNVTIDKARVERLAGLAQMIDGEADPSKRQAMWGKVTADPKIRDSLSKYMDPNDYMGGPKFLLAQARGYVDPLERERAQLQNDVLRKQVNAPVDDGSKLIEVNGQIVRVPRKGPAEPLYTAPGKAQAPIIKEVNGKLVSVTPDGTKATEIYGAGPNEDASKKIAGTLDELATIPSRYDSFKDAVGAFQGGDVPVISQAARLGGSVAATFSKTSPSEVRRAIDGTSETMAATIKTLIRKPGEGTWTDADQKRLDYIVGDLKKANNVAEYNRGLVEVKRRLEASFDLRLPDIKFPAGNKAQGKAQTEQMPRINNDADYGRLPPGTQYMAPDGTVRTKR